MDLESQEEDNSMSNAHEDVQEFIQKMGYQYTPMVIASSMMVHSMKMYRKYLNDNDYELMMKKIFESRHRINRHD